jgi:hypothetical protein
MRFTIGVAYSLTASAVIVGFVGCSNGGSQTAYLPGEVPGRDSQAVQGQALGSNPSQRAQNPFGSAAPGKALTPLGFVIPAAAGKPLVFVGDDMNNVVDIYLQTGKNKMVGQITGLNFPGSLATDASGNVYIPNSLGSAGGNVTVYAPPYTGSPMLTLGDPDGSPLAVAVSTDGVVAVVNFCNAPSCGFATGSVDFYPKGATTPCAMVTNRRLSDLYGGAFDDKGRLYVSAEHPTGGPAIIGEIRGECNAKTMMALSTTNPIGPAGGGIHVDRAGRIAIAVTGGFSSNPAEILTFKQPTMGALGLPVWTTPLTNTADFCAFDFAFLPSGRNLYVGDGCGKAVERYGFPNGGSAEKTIAFPNGAPYGIAVTPPLEP